MMHVKLFNSWDILSLEDDMNEFVKAYDKQDVLNIDVQTSVVRVPSLSGGEEIKFYYTGIITCDEPRV